jgi:hypothetical protein
MRPELRHRALRAAAVAAVETADELQLETPSLLMMVKVLLSVPEIASLDGLTIRADDQRPWNAVRERSIELEQNWSTLSDAELQAMADRLNREAAEAEAHARELERLVARRQSQQP